MNKVVWTTVTLALLANQGLAQDYIGSATPGLDEPMYQYDDQEVWKHGWIQINPYEHGYHSYRPYNYKHVFSQSAQASAWGMPSTMPYSQQYYMQYGNLNGLNGAPIPGGGMAPTTSYGMPTSMLNQSPLRQQPFNMNRLPQQLGNAPVQQVNGYNAQRPSVAPINFQQLHASPAAGPEYQRQSQQQAQMQHLLQQGQPQYRGPSFR